MEMLIGLVVLALVVFVGPMLFFMGLSMLAYCADVVLALLMLPFHLIEHMLSNDKE